MMQPAAMDTIFALSSGAPPAGIAVIRVSGPAAGGSLELLAGRVPPARKASAVVLRDHAGLELDRALVLWMPGPGTATGEDVAELHLHGGRAVVAAVEAALGDVAGFRRAEAGEFTRRAYANGRIDLAEAEGLADLLTAETELQRRAALATAGGALSRQIEDWRTRVLLLGAQVEAVLDFGDEDDVSELSPDVHAAVEALACEIGDWLDRPLVEPLREGVRVVLAGPPNAGKSTLFNALVEYEAAITAASPGTTRDLLERPVAIAGIPFTFIDTAGLRESTADEIEKQGIARARSALDRADLILWLGPEGRGPEGAWEIAAKSDLGQTKRAAKATLSARSGEGLQHLKGMLVDHARRMLPVPGTAALNCRQHTLLADARHALTQDTRNMLIMAENLRVARLAFDCIAGRASTEDMLDALFGRFCIGK
jgi:tRNA modification GTPase